ncbi:hypothetical protein HRG_012320 [Hirsutella rhossiliensis]
MCVHRPGLGWSPRATCYPSFAKGGPSIAVLSLRTPANPWLLPTSGTWGWPRQPPAAHFQPYSPALPTPCSINICHSTSSSNSQKAAGDNMSTVSLVQPDYPARFAPSPPPTDSQDPPACPLVVASHRSLDLQALLESSRDQLASSSSVDSTRSAPASLSRTQCPSNYRRPSKGTLQYYHNLFLSFTLIRYWYCWTFFLRRLTHTNLTPSPLLNFQPPAPYFTHDHRTRWSRLFKNLASSFPHTPASDLSPSSKKTCFIGCPPPLCVTPHLHFHGDYICHVLTMSASQLNRRDGLESDDDNITEYTVPALIVRDHSYQPIVTRTLSSVDTFPTIQPIVSFTGPVIGSGRDLLHGNSAAALDDTQLSCCGFVQLSTFICPGIPGKTPFKGFHPFQVFVIFPIHTNPWTSLCKKMTERRDSQFQSNALFTCTGKIAGLLDHQIMKHAPAFDQDYIFIVVPDTWTFHDKAMSDQASATQLLPTTPKSAVGNPRTIALRWPGLPLRRNPRPPKAPPPHAACFWPSRSLMLASSRSLPDPYQTPTKRPRLSPETSTIITDCDGQDSHIRYLLLSVPGRPRRVRDGHRTGQSPRHIRLWLYQTSRVDIFPTTARPTSAQEYSLNFKASNETIQHDNMSHHPQNQLPKARIAHSLLFLFSFS